MAYSYTYANWSTPHSGSWTKLAERLPDSASILELGSFEGGSACWFSDNIMDHPESTLTCVDTWAGGEEVTRSGLPFDFEIIKTNFFSNIAQSKNASKVEVIKGDSSIVLPTLMTQGRKFDLVYIDASHVGIDVLFDAVLSYKMLNKHGFILLDDYDNKMATQDKTLRPRTAIDSLITVLGYRVESSRTNSNQLWIRKME
jgi:predicted O-methyltransferase YrrM